MDPHRAARQGALPAAVGEVACVPPELVASAAPPPQQLPGQLSRTAPSVVTRAPGHKKAEPAAGMCPRVVFGRFSAVACSPPSSATSACSADVHDEYDDVSTIRSLSQRPGFTLVATALVRGSFDQCIAFDIDCFRTAIPPQLGLPLCETYYVRGRPRGPTRTLLEVLGGETEVRRLPRGRARRDGDAAQEVHAAPEAAAGLYLCRRPLGRRAVQGHPVSGALPQR